MTNPWPYPTNTPGLLSGMEGLAYPQFVPSPATYSQYPTDVMDYGIDWTDFLPTGDEIISSIWTAHAVGDDDDPPDPGLVLAFDSFTTTSTTVWVSGGVSRHLYRVFNTITTLGGRDATRMLTFKIKRLKPATWIKAAGSVFAHHGVVAATAFADHFILDNTLPATCSLTVTGGAAAPGAPSAHGSLQAAAHEVSPSQGILSATAYGPIKVHVEL